MPGDLKTQLAQHKPLLIGGATVVAIALYARAKASGASSAGTTAAAYDPTTGLPVGTAVSDTTGTDTFNALQPILQQLQDTVDGLSNPAPVATSKPKPSPKPAPKPKPKPEQPKNGKPAPTRPVMPLGHPTKAPTQYEVRRNDTLWGIAGRYHTTWQKIWNANRGVIGPNPNLIKPGQKLTIP